MALIVVETEFSEPLSEEGLGARAGKLAQCAPPRNARWIRSYLSSDRRRMIPGRLRRRSHLRSHRLGLADPVGPHRRVMEQGRALRSRVLLGKPFEGIEQDVVGE